MQTDKTHDTTSTGLAYSYDVLLCVPMQTNKTHDATSTGPAYGHSCWRAGGRYCRRACIIGILRRADAHRRGYGTMNVPAAPMTSSFCAGDLYDQDSGVFERVKAAINGKI